jgi:hypothetical protein
MVAPIGLTRDFNRICTVIIDRLRRQQSGLQQHYPQTSVEKVISHKGLFCHVCKILRFCLLMKFLFARKILILKIQNSKFVIFFFNKHFKKSYLCKKNHCAEHYKVFTIKRL